MKDEKKVIIDGLPGVGLNTCHIHSNLPPSIKTESKTNINEIKFYSWFISRNLLNNETPKTNQYILERNEIRTYRELKYEYDLIMQKESLLSKNVRDTIVTVYNQLF